MRRCFFSLWIPIVIMLASCTDQEPQYFPLREGLYRQYDVTVNTVFLEKKSKYAVRNLAPEDMDGRTVFPQRINQDIVHFYADTANGIRRVATRRTQGAETVTDNSESLVLPQAVGPGSRWEQETTTAVLETVVDPFRRIYRLEIPVNMQYTVAAVDARVRVPAGTFYDCLEVRGAGHAQYEGDPAIRKADVDVESVDWYAPAVGLVKSFRRETTTNKNLKQGEFRMELEIVERD